MIKFLVIRFSSIGDIVLTTPVVRVLKNKFPDCEIHYLTKKSFSFLLENNPHIDKVISFDNNLKDIIDNLKNEFYDYIIDLHHNIRSKRIKSALAIPNFTIDKLNIKKWLLVNFKINKLPEKHIVDRYLDTLSVFDINKDKQTLDYFIPQVDEYNLSLHHPDFSKKPYVAFVIGATYYTKQIPKAIAVDIMNKSKLPFILLGGKEDIAKSIEIENELQVPFVNLCGQINLNQSASLIKNAKIVVSSDTGLMHIAAAFNKIIISIWGNTVPEFGMTPYLPNADSIIIENKNLKCRPCSKIGFNKCPKKHFDCMLKIDIDHVVQNLRKLY